MVHARSFLAVSSLLLGLAGPLQGQCQIDRAVLQGPERVVAGESYTVSWPNVLSGPKDSYTVERATSPDFSGAERVRTNRPAQTFTAPASGSLYHRVLFDAACLPIGQPSPTSNTFVVEVASCALAAAPAALNVTPARPPAFTTYVVWWGPGEALSVAGRFLYRLRRTTPYDVKESVSENPSAAFTDAPGTYTYQVRLELPCGAAGPWSAPYGVTVGGAIGTLVLVSDPAPVDMAASPAAAETAFSVRNAGTQPVTVTLTTGPSVSVLSPASGFTLAPNQTQRLSVRFGPVPPSFPSPTVASWVQLQTGDGGTLKVPVGLFGGLSAESPVTWDRPEIVVPRNGGAVEATFRNAGPKTALVYASVREPWLTMESIDGQTWDRPLAAGEARTVRLVVDRSRRRATDGTEVARVSVVTSGFTSLPQDLAVIDDGPPLTPASGPIDPPAASGGTRILYASMPNAVDARGVGRFTGDLWLSNLDSVSPTDVQLLLSPLGQKGQTWRFVVRLAPGETRRYRNLMGSLIGYEGACSVEVRSASPAVSATALVSNVPFESVTARRAGLAGGGGNGASGQYGFELRPVAPGEGVKAGDDKFVLTGLAHDARRRTNILLTETSGYDTTVLVELYESSRGAPILIDGSPVQVTVQVPALGTVQLNDASLFGAAVDPLDRAPYARITWLDSVPAPDGTYHGSVVPFATVIDQSTQDASLRVGVSPRKLDPIPSGQPTSSQARTPEAGLPFSGGPAPLLMPVAHAIGGPLASGEKPFWRTRVTLTNTHEQEQRTVRLKLVAKSSDGSSLPVLVSPPIPLQPKAVLVYDDVLEEQFEVAADSTAYGALQIEAIKKTDGSGAWQYTWSDVDVQTETYTADPSGSTSGEFKTGMEGFSYLHGYSSFQSNLGAVQIEGAESSSSFRTNLILEEVGGAYCQVAVSAYRSGSFVPLATKAVTLAPFEYASKDLFRNVLGLDLADLSDIRVVVRQIDGDGVFMAFASKIDLRTGDPANLFLRPASAGTGR